MRLISTILLLYAAVLLGLLAIGIVDLDSVGLVFIAACLLPGVLRLILPLMKRRASIWFSGTVAAVFMVAAGIVYGLWWQ